MTLARAVAEEMDRQIAFLHKSIINSLYSVATGRWDGEGKWPFCYHAQGIELLDDEWQFRCEFTPGACSLMPPVCLDFGRRCEVSQ